MLLEAGRDIPRIGPVAGGGADSERGTHRERHRADPVTGAPVRAPPREAIGSPEEHGEAGAVDDQQYRQLAADERGYEAERSRQGEPSPRRPGDRCCDRPERGGAERVGERLLEQVRRVGERRRRDRADRGRDRPGPRDDEAGQPVGGEDRRRHHEHADQLRRLPRVGRVEPPRRGDEIRVERAEAARLAEARRRAGRGDPA